MLDCTLDNDMPHRTVHITEHKASLHKRNITHRFSTVIYTLLNSGARFTQCRKLIILTETTNKHIHNIRGSQLKGGKYLQTCIHFSAPLGDQTWDLMINKCTVWYKAISLYRDHFWAASLASCSHRPIEVRLPLMFFMQEVQGHVRVVVSEVTTQHSHVIANAYEYWRMKAGFWSRVWFFTCRLEPILDRIATDNSIVICPMIDAINDKTLEFSMQGGLAVGGFTWSLHFTWRSVPEREQKRRKSEADPARSFYDCF